MAWAKSFYPVDYGAIGQAYPSGPYDYPVEAYGADLSAVASFYGPLLPDGATTPSGYDATLPNLSLAVQFMPLQRYIMPLLGTEVLGQFPLGTPNRDPTVGAFIRDAGTVAGAIGEIGQPQYVPDDTPGNRVGEFVVGESVIESRPMFHGTVTFPDGPLGREVIE